MLKPYYESKFGKLYNCNCFDFLNENKTPFDLVLTDPPYNAKNIGPNQRVYDNTIMQLSEKEYSEFCFDWFEKVDKISKTIVFTPGIANTHFYPQPKWQICWHKPASVSFNRMGGFNAWEPIFVYKDTKMARLGQDYLKYNTLNFNKGIEKNHPCPKVLKLWRHLLLNFSFNGDLVFDPFMGSGTTSVLCEQHERRWIGCEISEKYCEIIAKRTVEEEKQTRLF